MTKLNRIGLWIMATFYVLAGVNHFLKPGPTPKSESSEVSDV